MSDWPEWPVARLADLPDPGARGFLVGEGDWPFRGLVVLQQGQLYAYANVCPHARHPLDFPAEHFFTPDKTLLRCSSHGALFDPGSGECVLGPCLGRRLIALELRVVADEIRVRAPGSLQDLDLDFSRPAGTS